MSCEIKIVHCSCVYVTTKRNTILNGADDRIKKELRGIAVKLFVDLTEEAEERDSRKRERRQKNNDGEGEGKRLHAT